ncbi:MAG: hypothetical protein RQ714_08605 [Nitrosomonas sp.]|nr:hypothetical protein [Nitrosomonas sp.]
MKRKLLLIAMFMLASSAQAATEFEDTIPLDLAKIFLNLGNAPAVGIYSDIMEDFPRFDIPEDFSILGSLDQGVVQRVVLATSNTLEEANSLLLESLAMEGWRELPLPNRVAAPQPRGFVPAGGQQPNAIPLDLCHDDFGNMTLTFNAGDDGNIVSLIHTNNRMYRGRYTCAQQEQQRSQSFGMRGNMTGRVSEHIPTLKIPEESGGPGPGAGTPRMAFVSSAVNSLNDVETRSDLTIDWAIGTLYDFFAEQLEEQGWLQDSAWTGSITAGGNWTKSPEEDLNLIAILGIVETAEDAFEMKLRVLSRSN